MLLLEFNKENDELVKEIENHYDVKVLKINSFGVETFTQIIIPLAIVLSPVFKTTLEKIIEDSNISIKVDGIELSGNYKKVISALKEIQDLKKDE